MADNIKPFQIRNMDKGLHKNLKQIALDTDTSLNAVVLTLLKEGVERYEKNKTTFKEDSDRVPSS